MANPVSIAASAVGNDLSTENPSRLMITGLLDADQAMLDDELLRAMQEYDEEWYDRWTDDEPVEQVQVIKLCLEAGASPNAITIVRAGLSGTALHYAASIGASVDLVELLLDHAANVNCDEAAAHWIQLKKPATETKITPLHCAVASFFGVREGQILQIVQLLILNGANVNARTGGGKTPLHVACASGFTSVVEFLLGQDADIESRDNNGWTPIFYAAHAS